MAERGRRDVFVLLFVFFKTIYAKERQKKKKIEQIVSDGVDKDCRLNDFYVLNAVVFFERQYMYVKHKFICLGCEAS